MANMKKYSDMGAIGHLCAHYERSVQPGHYGNADIDQARLSEDRVNLAPTRTNGQTAYIKQQIAAVMDGKKLRKDAVRMCSWGCHCAREFSKRKGTRIFSCCL